MSDQRGRLGPLGVRDQGSLLRRGRRHMAVGKTPGVLDVREGLSDFNAAYLEELYERFLQHPESVDEDTRKWFEENGAPSVRKVSQRVEDDAWLAANDDVTQIHLTQQYVSNLREHGHVVADVNPIVAKAPHHALVDLSTHELNDAQLAEMPAWWVCSDAPEHASTALEVCQWLKQVYTGTIGFEFSHIDDGEERQWLTQTVESCDFRTPRSDEERKETLLRLIEVEEFEKFLHKTFAGQKRFSIEGVDMLVPMLDVLIRSSAQSGARHVMMGMAHRGRLNVLAHILGKPYRNILSEFHAAPHPDLVPSEGSIGINHGWTGDVKYHLGASVKRDEGDVRQVQLLLANNPSHLEFVNPVVEGYVRAAQEDRSNLGRPARDLDHSLAVLIHGDAAFTGEGIVAETLNLSRLAGYESGGTIHIITNNQIGFTADVGQGRSTRYASDLAKGFEIPIVHVNADDPEACIAVVRLAHTYRQRFYKDFLIDLIGYRRWGHNEMDDPESTQPQMYSQVTGHESVRALMAKALLSAGVVSQDEVARQERTVRERLQEALREVRSENRQERAPSIPQGEVVQSFSTSIPQGKLEELHQAVLASPPGFSVYPKLARILERRRNAFAKDGKVEWADAEVMAFASILTDGTAIRMTGQDTERGTFGHRHLVLHDEESGATYCPLQHLQSARASFEIYNSPLSETAVLGFEYGYNVLAPDSLVIWEAQFGDFANVAQVLIDQFLSSGRAKWAQASGLVLLLPHGYEGQGPEHSSARLERYLQLSAEGNWRVANPSSAAQYFHLLRQQAKQLRADPRPLIVMTPKSLLRNPRAASTVEELSEGSFRPVIFDALGSNHIERLVLASGKVAVDFVVAAEGDRLPAWLAVARVEQLYPFPEGDVKRVLDGLPNLGEVVWLQEEPQNMGAWTYMESHIRAILPQGISLRYVGRPERSSPAEGFADQHEVTQRELFEETWSK